MRLRGPSADSHRDERGYVAVITAVFMSALCFGLAAISVDVARWYAEMQRVQNAADAAALAGVTWMPQDLTTATSTARDVSARNGYTNGGAVSVNAARGTRPSELKVTVASTIPNLFGKFFGQGQITITRSAVADYTGPQPMGSPCNTYGNEPPGYGSGDAGPPGSVLSVPPGATCPRTPDFWFTIHGPEVYKTQGDQYMPRVCGGAESGCAGTTNDEARPEGYFMMVRVLPASVGTPLTVQLYDPAYVQTQSNCSAAPTPTGDSLATITNPWTDSVDAQRRYARHYNPVVVSGQTVRYCTGDDRNSGNRRGSETATVTSFALRAPSPDLNPSTAAPIPGCTRQWPGYATVTVGNLTGTDPSYLPNLARVFHQWVPLCTFTPSVAGDYYLQVRTNVALGGSLNSTCGTGASPGACSGSYAPADVTTSPVTQQTGDNASVLGNGSNRFSVRVTGAPAASVSVSAYGRMPMFANSDQSTTLFNLIRVLPGARGKSIIFNFFDVGDAAAGSGATVSVLRPTEATGDNLSNCRASGFLTATLANCSISGIRSSSGWNGQSESIIVPVPNNYSCNYSSPGGCWFRVQVAFPAGSAVTDATTWTATISGDPVRLIE